MSTSRLVAGGLLAAALVVSACGGESESPPTASVERVPQLRALTATQARDELASLGASAEFTTGLGGACAGLPPGGRVVEQQPPAGAALARDRVRVQLGCGSPTRRCAARDLHVTADGATGVFPGGGHSVFVQVVHRGATPCLLSDRIRLTLEDAGGRELAVSGIPVGIPVNRRLGTGQTLQYSLGWYGCPKSGSGLATVDAVVIGVSATGTMPHPPCIGGRPSTLRSAAREIASSGNRRVYAKVLQREAPEWAIPG